jgi:hypothetical protein
MLTVYALNQSIEWDSVVRSFNNYDVYWLSGYVKGFQIHGDGEPLLFFYDGEETRAVNVLMKRDIAEDVHFKGQIKAGKHYDFSTPYGYGGWLIEGEKTEGLFREYRKWCENHDIISEFVRFHPMVKNHIGTEDFYNIIQLGEVVHMDLSSPELIWENITSKNRNMIRKALKNDVKVYNGRYPEIYKTFREIYNGTMEKDAAEEYYYFEPEFYTSVQDDLAQNAQVFYAVKDEKIIAASIMLATNGMMNYHLSGSIREFGSLAPTNLILYQAALWGSANGCKTLYLGGGVGSGEDSLFKFKRAFYKGDLNHFFIGKKIYDHETYDELVRLRNPVEKPGYFPMYRG